MVLKKEPYSLDQLLQPVLFGVIIVSGFNIFLNTKEQKESLDLESYLLTAREKTIVLELLKGLSNKAIASQLFIAESTVKKHVQNIFKKLEVSSRQELVQKLKD